MPKRDLSAIAAAASADLHPIQRGAGLAGLMGGGGKALENARRLPLDQIELNPQQARQQFDEQALADLTESVRQHGVLQPIGVQRLAGGYRIVFGERRYRAAVAAGLREIPALVYDDLADADAAVFTALENLQREDLSYTDEARQYSRLTEVLACPATTLAEVLHVDHNRISRLLRIEREAPDLLAALDTGTLTFRDAVEAASKRAAVPNPAISHGEKSERTPRADMPEPRATPSAAAFKQVFTFQNKMRRLQPDQIPPDDRPDFRRTLAGLIDELSDLYQALDDTEVEA